MMVRAANRLQCIWGPHCVQLVVPRIEYNVFANYTIYNQLCREWTTMYLWTTLSAISSTANRLQSTCGPVYPYCMGPRIDYSLCVDQCVRIAWVRG